MRVEIIDQINNVVEIETDTTVIEIADFDISAQSIPKSIIEASGDLIVGGGAAAPQRLAGIADGHVLVRDSSESGGWIGRDLSAIETFTATRNALINGSFAIWQRQVAGTATERADDAYGPDRWVVLTEANPVNVKRIDGGQQRYAGQIIQKNASAQRVGLAQIIEGANCRRLRGKQVTLSFRGRLSADGWLHYAILEWTGTEDAVTSDPVATWDSDITSWAANYSASKGSVSLTANTWADCSLTVTLGSTFNNLVVFIWTDSQLAQNATLDIEAAQLAQGPNAGNFFENIADELARCQRYFITLGGAAASINYFAYATAGGQAPSLTLALPVEMRIAPVGTIKGSWVITNTSNPGLGATTPKTISIRAQSIGAGIVFFRDNDATTYVELEAEL